MKIQQMLAHELNEAAAGNQANLLLVSKGTQCASKWISEWMCVCVFLSQHCPKQQCKEGNKIKLNITIIITIIIKTGASLILGKLNLIYKG